MYQDYKAKIVKKAGNIESSVGLSTNIVSGIGTNRLQAYSTGGLTGVARQVQYDTASDNVLMTFDGSVSCTEGNDFTCFVYTYTATTPLTGTISLRGSNTALVPFFNIQGSGYFQGSVIIPKLQLSEGETQYVVVGVASPSEKSGNVSMYLDMKLHLSDERFFQPSK